MQIIAAFLALKLALSEAVSTNSTEWAAFMDCMGQSNISWTDWNITVNPDVRGGPDELTVVTNTFDEELENEVYALVDKCQEENGISFNYNAVNCKLQNNPEYFLSHDQFLQGNVEDRHYELPESRYDDGPEAYNQSFTEIKRAYLDDEGHHLAKFRPLSGQLSVPVRGVSA